MTATAPVLLPSESFADLKSLPPDPDWLWKGMLAAGSLTMLAGRGFVGKSMFVGGLLKALDEGQPFLGFPTRRASALLVTEEGKDALRFRADRFGILDIGSEYVARAGSLGFEWEDLVAAAAAQAVNEGHKLLVFDPFAGLARLNDEQENDSGAITSRLRPLQDVAARDDLAVLFLHHMNGFGQPRGSSAFQAVVDISLRLYRDNKKSHNITLVGEGRFPGATPAHVRAQLIEASDGWHYERVDNPRVPFGTEEDTVDIDALLIAALEASPEGLTYDDFKHVPGLSVDIAKRRLPALVGVAPTGRGVKGDPLRYVIAS